MPLILALRSQRQEDICELTQKEKRKEKPNGASELVRGEGG